MKGVQGVVISDKKCKWMLFADYLLALLISVLGFMVFSWMLSSLSGAFLYSVVMSLVFFGLVYSRCWKKARSDLKYQEAKGISGILKLIAPITIVFLIVIAIFALIKYNIIPIRDIVTDVRYVIEDNQPRQKVEIFLYDSFVQAYRLIFLFLLGLHPQDDVSVLALLIAPMFCVLGGISGYYAGLKNFYFTSFIDKTGKKVKDKFNE